MCRLRYVLALLVLCMVVFPLFYWPVRLYFMWLSLFSSSSCSMPPNYAFATTTLTLRYLTSTNFSTAPLYDFYGGCYYSFLSLPFFPCCFAIFTLLVMFAATLFVMPYSFLSLCSICSILIYLRLLCLLSLFTALWFWLLCYFPMLSLARFARFLCSALYHHAATNHFELYTLQTISGAPFPNYMSATNHFVSYFLVSLRFASLVYLPFRFIWH